MTPLEDRDFLFITGKGGTGKTTVAACLAVALARRGKRVLIAMSEAKERISTLFEVPPLESDIVAVESNIWAVKIAPEAALREYGQMILKSRALYNAVFDNRYVRSFFAAVPGLYQWAMLGKAWYHSTEILPDGSRRFDVVLFDAPATGHGLEMLRVPKVIVDVAPAGLLRRDADEAWAMFQDPARSGVVVVTLPEDMPVNETLELAEAVTGELGLPIAQMVVNAKIDMLFSPEERRQLLAERSLDPRNPGDEAVSAGTRRAIGERVQAESLAKLDAGLRAPTVYLPRLLREPTTRAAIEELSRVFSRHLQEAAVS